MDIRREMPLLARHEGEWDGTYTYVAADGTITDRHRSHVRCSLSSEGNDYYQVNTYTWDDGRTEEHRFPGVYLGGGRCRFDTERIRGEFFEVDSAVIYLQWVYKAAEDIRLYELIVLSEDGKHRNRTWQWHRDGICFQRTLITETRTL
ncbi:DUF3598 family protein [Nonomuraea sp. NPDC050556]|uniref:DUF3598 family protein n=1 Tax=Nonomuraea sp. NPDC050556 TaxID=3364369 RepID=UPI00378885FF